MDLIAEAHKIPHQPAHIDGYNHTMHLPTLILTGLSITIGCVSAASLRETCGDGIVLSVSSLPFDGGEITVTETKCPGFASVSQVEERNELEKRNIVQCSNDNCKVDCLATGSQPFVSDCQQIANAVEAKSPNMFLVNPQTMITFNYTTCAFGFGNLDTVPYDVCYNSFGYNAIITADDCFADYPGPNATPGGYCLDPNSKWGIEVYNPEGKLE